MTDLSNPLPLGLGKRTWPLFLLGFLALFAILFALDGYVFRMTLGWPPWVHEFFWSITDWGLSEWILIPSLMLASISGLLALVMPRRIPRLALLQTLHLNAFIFFAVGVPGLFATLIKRAIGRGRPEVLDTVGPYGFQTFFNNHTFQSFPSGHATTALATAMALSFLSPRWLPIALVIAGLVAFSRIAIGAHYPTDVLGGIVVGTLGAYFVRQAFAWRRWAFDREASGTIQVRPLVAVQRLVRGTTIMLRRGSA